MEKPSPNADVSREQSLPTSSVLQAVISGISEGVSVEEGCWFQPMALVLSCEVPAALQWRKDGGAAVLLIKSPTCGSRQGEL